MTNEQAKKMLKAKLECLKRETSGTDIDCNCRNCDECSLNYEQGNMAEQKEALDMAIQALEQQTRDCKTCKRSNNGECAFTEECHECMWKSKYEQQPCEDCISRAEALKYSHIEYDDDGVGHKVIYAEDIEELPSVTPQPKIGKWIIIDDCEQFIAKCSECGRIEDSRMISKYPYCHCGAKMEGDTDAKQLTE